MAGMGETTLRLLLVEDNPGDITVVRQALSEAKLASYLLDAVSTLDAGFVLLSEKTYDIALLGLALPDTEGLHAVQRFHDASPSLPLLVLPDSIPPGSAIDLMKAGAMDFMEKDDVNTPSLERSIRYSIERRQLWSDLERHSRELESSETNLRNIIMANLDAMMIVNPESRVIFANPAAEKLLNRASEDLVGSLFEFSLKTQVTPEVLIPKGRGEAAVAEMRVTRVEWKGRPAFLATFRDVTERKHVEEALRKSDRRYRRITETVTDYIVSVRVVDGRAVETIHGSSCLSVTGYTSEDFERDQYLWLRMVPPEDQPVVIRQAEMALKGAQPVSIEHRIIRKDGALRWVNCTIVFHRDESGNLTSYDDLIRDITEERLAEEELRKSKEELEQRVEERTDELLKANQSLGREIGEHKATERMLRGFKEFLESLLKAMQDGLVVTNQAGVHVDVNPAFCRMTGFTRKELLGTGAPYPYWPPESRDEIRSILFLRREIEPKTVECMFMRKNGERFPVLISPSWINQAEGKLEYFMATVKDITDRKQTEEKLQQRTRELQERNQELDAFAHTVAHDLKTPLGNILTSISIINRALDSLGPEKTLELLTVIQRNCRKSVNIIDELLLLAEVRMTEVEMAPLNMGGIVDEVLLRLSSVIDDTGGEIQLPGTWPIALGYAPWVEEIWCNYISNALRYGGQPPRVEVGAAESRGNRVRFWVRDNGRGMPPEQAEKLFTPFVRMTQLHTQGHGLGLSIVRRIAEKLGGEVGMETAEEGGCVFHFTLPRDL